MKLADRYGCGGLRFKYLSLGQGQEKVYQYVVNMSLSIRITFFHSFNKYLFNIARLIKILIIYSL